MPEWLSEDDGAVVIALWLVPGAARTEISGVHGTALRVRVSAPPERGRANRALTDFLAELLDPAEVILVSGARGRRKRVRVVGLATDEIGRRLSV